MDRKNRNEAVPFFSGRVSKAI